MGDVKLTDGEVDALEWLRARNGSVLSNLLEERTARDCLGSIEPGMAIFRKLAKRDLVVITEESLIDPADPEMGEWSPTIELTDAGRAALSKESDNGH